MSTTRPICPPPQNIDFIEEPFFRVSIITPKDYTGTLMDLCQTRRGDMTKLEYLSPERVELHYQIPLAEVVVDFFDQMKSRTQGYASLDYELSGYQRSQPGAGRPAAERRPRRRVLAPSCIATRRSPTATGCARS